MSESLLASLPRFDLAPAAMPGPCDFSVGTPAQMSQEMGEGARDLPDAGLGDAEASAELDKAAQAELLASLESMLAELPGAIAQMESEIRQHANETVSALAADMFPKLSELFLSEEIARHLPDLLAPSIKEVELLTSPAAADLLTSAVGNLDGSSVRYSVSGDDHLAPGQIRISWTAGGFDYDFEEMFSACMQRLSANEQKVED